MAERDKQQAIAKRESELRFYEYLVSWHAEQTRVYQAAQETGAKPYPRYPHPADFRFDDHSPRNSVFFSTETVQQSATPITALSSRHRRGWICQ